GVLLRSKRASVHRRRKNLVSSTKLIQKPVTIGMMWISTSSTTAGSRIRYGNQVRRIRRRGAGGSGRDVGAAGPERVERVMGVLRQRRRGQMRPTGGSGA